MMANNAVSLPNNIGATISVALVTDQSLKLFVSCLVEGTSEKDVVQKMQCHTRNATFYEPDDAERN